LNNSCRHWQIPLIYILLFIKCTHLEISKDTYFVTLWKNTKALLSIEGSFASSTFYALIMNDDWWLNFHPHKHNLTFTYVMVMKRFMTSTSYYIKLYYACVHVWYIDFSPYYDCFFQKRIFAESYFKVYISIKIVNT
jgi:hypothetical protein